MKSILTTIFLIVTSGIVNAQVEVYKTYNDYLSNISVKYTGFRSKIIFADNNYLYLKNEKNENVKLLNKDYWGLKYKDNLFRLHVGNPPFRLVSMGKICYYENGTAYIEALIKGSESGYYCSEEGRLAFSDSLNSPLTFDILLINKEDLSHHQFFNKNPQYKELFDCLLSKMDAKDKTPENLIPSNKTVVNKKSRVILYTSVLTEYIIHLDFDFVRKCVTAYNGNILSTIKMKASSNCGARIYILDNGEELWQGNPYK